MDIIYQYGLFLAKTVTVVAAIGLLIAMAVFAKQRKAGQLGELQIFDLSEQYNEMKDELMLSTLSDEERKAWLKELKKTTKAEAKARKEQIKKGITPALKPCLYVLNFKGSLDANEVSSLRKEITAVLAVAKPQDEILINLESPGGMVHGYGLAASQLTRIKRRGIKLTVAVDKVAASGGYMMACVADRIVAAPFAVVGSIGVVAQLPNIHRLLKKHDVDIEMHTAGEYKRTLTMLGENSEVGREKFKEELNETHLLFKQFVHEHRPVVDIEKVATGEHWFGTQAASMNLVDDISTSDEIVLDYIDNYDVIGVKYTQRKKLMNRFSKQAADCIDTVFMRWIQRGQKPLL